MRFDSPCCHTQQFEGRLNVLIALMVHFMALWLVKIFGKTNNPSGFLKISLCMQANG